VITRLQVKGFKNLQDIDVRFGPFTCIAGPNGVGKSNLFDAIGFLSLLTQHSIMEAAQLLRETKGRSPEPRSLFTSFNGYRATQMSFGVEMIVDRNVQDDFGVKAEASISVLSYDLTLGLRTEDGVDRLELIREELKPIRITDARRELGFVTSKEFRDSAITGARRGGALISTSAAGGEITVHQEGHGGRKVPAPKSSRTIIGGTTTSDFPTVLAAHREMASWRTLLLEPSAMRASSLYQDERLIDARGGNLPGTIFRLSKTESRRGGVYAELANRLSELVEDVGELQIRDDPKTETLTLEVRGKDGVFHPARSLSDGTLRFLVLATLGLDPQVQGVICLEEPENGIHPERIPVIVQLIRDIAVDANFPIGTDNTLRQVMVNTHSPDVVRNVDRNDLVYVDAQRLSQGSAFGQVAAVSVPQNTWRAKLRGQAPVLSPGRLRAYLGENEQLHFQFFGQESEPA
jgi:predicted ATPase